MTGRRPAGMAVLGPILAIALAACGGASTGTRIGPSPDPGALQVVTTTTVFADMVAQVGGSKVSVVSLVPKGGDVHTFDPTPATLIALSEADLVVANGLGLDDALTGLASGAGTQGTILKLGEDLAGATLLGPPGQPNPHLWLNVAYARLYVARIATALEAVAPAQAAVFKAGAAAYDARLATLDGWVKDSFAAIPAASRKVISMHDAFPYFAQAYGIDLVGSVLSAPGQDPSASDIAGLVAAIKSTGARAIFSEVQFSDKLAQTIAAESGAKVESNLYDDTLGDPPVDTFEGVIRWDVERILAALQ